MKEIIKKHLIESIKELQSFDIALDIIYKNGLCLINFLDPLNKVIQNQFHCFLDEEGVDLVYWWLYDKSPKNIIDEDLKINLDKVEDFVDYVIENNFLENS